MRPKGSLQGRRRSPRSTLRESVQHEYAVLRLFVPWLVTNLVINGKSLIAHN